ncbi:hypothetical protein [Sporosarcina highlanderae]|uniref:Uncharacterized protein n=1 Tax=Sporosarcina highlanderae TaxID=3035916 RepID=A0ABT8JW27_9BACL|nr:hypothetical protein [Sporosarcina highlanderae]MDN4608552.1 hypothetical protein [Sporosarcina highlanderae]
MTKNKKILFSLLIALLLGIPFKWIQYKGDSMVSVFQVLELGPRNMFFDISLLALNTFIIFFIWSVLLKPKNMEGRAASYED